MKFFENQDFVWSTGLIVSGLFIAFAVIRFGVDRYRREVVNTSPRDFYLGKFYNINIAGVVPALAIILIAWYFYQSIVGVGDDFWNPFRMYSAGTLVLQWGIAFILFLSLNRWMVKRALAPHYFEGVEHPPKKGEKNESSND